MGMHLSFSPLSGALIRFGIDPLTYLWFDYPEARKSDLADGKAASFTVPVSLKRVSPGSMATQERAHPKGVIGRT